jgi:predicted nucleic acid-binding protein
VQELFWDSGVFTAYLCDEQEKYDIASIQKYLEEAKSGQVKIYTSTIASAEILPRRMKKAGDFEAFLEDFQGAVIAIDPSPNVMRLSGRLRDLPYKKGKSTGRQLATPDAILLATAIHLCDAYGVKLTAFHTFDGGGSKDANGNRSVPMLGYEHWCEGFSPEQQRIAQKVIDLNRAKPIHPEPGLDFHAG